MTRLSDELNNRDKPIMSDFGLQKPDGALPQTPRYLHQDDVRYIQGEARHNRTFANSPSWQFGNLHPNS